MFSYLRFKANFKKWFVVGMGVVLALALLLGCAPAEKPPAEKPPAEKPPAEKPPAEVPTIKVGLIGAMSGPYAVYGQALCGAEYVFEKVNEAGGIKSMGGAKIEWFYADTESNVDKAVGEYERLVFDKKVDAIITAQRTEEVLAYASRIDENKIPVMSTIVTAEPLFELNMNSWFQVSIPGAEIGTWLVIFINDLIDEFNIKHDKILLFSSDAPHHKGAYMDAERAALEKYGLLDVTTEKMFSARIDQDGMNSMVLQIKDMNPDIVIMNSLTRADGFWFRALHNVGWSPLVYISGSTPQGYPRIWETLGEDLCMEQLGTKGVFIPGFANPKVPNKPFQDFYAGFKPWIDAKKLAWSEFQVLAGQAAYAFVDCWEKEGTKDAEKISSALHQLKIPYGNATNIMPICNPELSWYPSGRIKYVELFCMQWHGKEIQVVLPKELRTAPPNLPGQ